MNGLPKSLSAIAGAATIHYEHPDPECAVNLVANEAREAKIDVVVNNSAAFGGYDAVLTLAREGILPPRVDRWAIDGAAA